MSNSIGPYFPSVYTEVIEIEELIKVEDILFNSADDKFMGLRNNQFIITADLIGIEYYEVLLNITANASLESLEFRRERVINRFSAMPPFTLPLLKQRLDVIIGKDKYKAYLDFNNYILYVESSAVDQYWFHEILVTITKIKPANMIFTNKPLLSHTVKVNEEIGYSSVNYNYKLGISWILGSKPFVDYTDKGLIKLADVTSLQSSYLNAVASFSASDITSVLINDSVAISVFLTKSAIGNMVTIEYVVIAASVVNITNIKLLDAASNILSSSIVYIPVLADVSLKHTIKVIEGV